MLDGKQIVRIQNHNFSRRLIASLRKQNNIPDDLYDYFTKYRHKALFDGEYLILGTILDNNQYYSDSIRSFVKFGVSLFLPIYNKHKLAGFIFLGPKLSGEAYYPQDLRLFDELIDNISLSFENINLYQEIKKHTMSLETKIQQRTKELCEQNENQTRLMADISHELQTPLAILKGNLSLINQKKLKHKDKEKGFLRMDRSVDRLSNIIKDLIFLSKVDAGIINLEKNYFDLGQLVRDVYNDTLILAEDKNINFKVKIQKGINFYGDQEKIRSLLFNLISNALKYTTSDRHIYLSVETNEQNIYIIVKDEGIGILANDIPNIFSRFYRIYNNNVEKGSGLGLAISKWIVEAHQGKIEVESKLGEGSIFKVILPFKDR